MHVARRLTPLAFLAVVIGACATTPARLPVTDVPPGTYVLVEPTGGEYTAVTIGANAFSVRMGERTWSGQHWLDSEGRLHIADDAGECAGQESIWTYVRTGNRVTLTKVSDMCAGRDMPATLVYERR